MSSVFISRTWARCRTRLLMSPTPDRIVIPQALRHPSDRLELYSLEHFLTEDECVDLINLIRPHLRRSTTTNDAGKYANYRTSQTCDLGRVNHPLVADVERRICQVMGFDASYSEPIQAQWYDVGQEFGPHTDYFEPNEPEFVQHAQERGQRTWTFMIYLNATRSGGATRFVNINAEFRPKSGRAVIWNSLTPQGEPNSDSMHWATPIEAGFKVILTKWFRAKGTGPMFVKEANQYLPPYTQSGFLKRQVPPDLFAKIVNFYQENSAQTQSEHVPGFIDADADAGRAPSELIPLSEALRIEIHAVLFPLVEAWIGDFLEATFVYGIRRYLRGAKLRMHRDRGVTHVVSVIVNVAQDVEQPWPLQIEDHFGRIHQVLLAPGDMMFYEGARLQHGRPQPLQGRNFASLFVHYKLQGRTGEKPASIG